MEHLDFSYQKCRGLNLSKDLSEETLEDLEAFASRFARTADIFTQKVVAGLLLLLQEDIATFIDRMNFCEKIRLIPSADSLVEIRALRNAVAHEYRQTNLLELYGKILELTPNLNQSISLAKEFLQKKNLFDGKP